MAQRDAISSPKRLRSSTVRKEAKGPAPSKSPAPVMVGSVTTTLMSELQMLVVELNQRRTFDDDVAAFLELDERLHDRFATFQARRMEQRAASAGAPR